MSMWAYMSARCMTTFGNWGQANAQRDILKLQCQVVLCMWYEPVYQFSFGCHAIRHYDVCCSSAIERYLNTLAADRVNRIKGCKWHPHGTVGAGNHWQPHLGSTPSSLSAVFFFVVALQCCCWCSRTFSCTDVPTMYRRCTNVCWSIFTARWIENVDLGTTNFGDQQINLVYVFNVQGNFS